MIDTHCHLDFQAFDHDRNEVIDKCVKGGMEYIILPGVNSDNWPTLRSLCASNPFFYYAAGVHPWQVCAQRSSGLSQEALQQELAQHFENTRCVAVGETGLDKLHASDESAWAQQLEMFTIHCNFAKQYQLPLIIHNVRAHQEVFNALKKTPNVSGVIHAFNGSKEIAQQFVKHGFYLGAGGAITYPRAKKTREAFLCTDLKHIVLETDAPSMPLCGQQGQRNSPQYLINIARALAEIKGISLQEVREVTTQNAKRLFGLG